MEKLNTQTDKASTTKAVQEVQYEISGGEDWNDIGALRNAMSSIDLDKPQSFGGFVRGTNKTINHEMSNLFASSDLSSSTRIIAVCGVLEEDIMRVDKDSDWFLSDFLAFWHIFKGLTERQSWYHCLDLGALLEKHRSEYLHGNPYRTRKVVLNKDILKETSTGKSPLIKLTRPTLRKKFENKVFQECKEAQAANDNVMILIFGHGEEISKDIFLGTQRNRLEMRAFAKGIGQFKCYSTVLTTACYSGAWAGNPNLDISLLTGASESTQSRSWRKTASLGRACGSMFATAIIKKLTRKSKNPEVSVTDYDSDVEDYSEDQVSLQDETFAEFSSSVYYTLLKDFDRRGMVHEFTFAAQGDEWSSSYRKLTGIPAANYQERWDQLEDWPKDVNLHPGDPLNRDPYVTEEERADYKRLEKEHQAKIDAQPKRYAPVSAHGNRKRKFSTFYGGSLEGLANRVNILADQYFGGRNPDEDDLTNNLGLHGLLKDIRAGKINELSLIEKAIRALEYRMSQMARADEYLEILRIHVPQRCCDWKGDNWDVKRPRILYDMIHEKEVLFPGPVTEAVGRGFGRGLDYLVMALDESGLTLEMIQERLDSLADMLHSNLEEQKDRLKRIPELQSKRRRLYGAFNATMSPGSSPRNSIGGSGYSSEMDTSP